MTTFDVNTKIYLMNINNSKSSRFMVKDVQYTHTDTNVNSAGTPMMTNWPTLRSCSGRMDGCHGYGMVI